MELSVCDSPGHVPCVASPQHHRIAAVQASGSARGGDGSVTAACMDAAEPSADEQIVAAW